MEPELYTYWRSSASWRIRIVLNLKSITHVLHPINLLTESHLEVKFKNLNPNCSLPTLVHGKTVISQSTAIVEYIEEAFPYCNVFPTDPVAKAKVREIMFLICCDIHPLQNLRVLKKIDKIAASDQEKSDKSVAPRLEWGQFWISRGFDVLETILKECSGIYCVGDNVTAADAYLIPQIYNARRFNVDMTRYPLILGIEERCGAMDAFIKAHPDQQPDAVQ